MCPDRDREEEEGEEGERDMERAGEGSKASDVGEGSGGEEEEKGGMKEEEKEQEVFKLGLPSRWMQLSDRWGSELRVIWDTPLYT